MPNRTVLALLAAALLLAGCSQAPVTAPAPAAPLPSPTPVPISTAKAEPVSRWTYSALAFQDAQTGWAALASAEETAVVRTADSGASWTRLGAPGFLVQALRFQGEKHGVAIGTSFSCQTKSQDCSLLIAATADGGATWETRYRHTLAEGLSDHAPVLDFTGDGAGYALYVGSRASLLLTTPDGGRSWAAATEPAPGWEFQSAAFVTGALGWAHARNCEAEPCRYAIFATADGGKRWQQQYDLPAGRRIRPGNISFADARHGWLYPTAQADQCTMGGCTGPLYRTQDGGRSWAEVLWTEARQTDQGGVGFPRAVEFLSPDRGWMLVSAGAATGVGGVGVTTDGGKSWVRHAPPGVRDFTLLSVAGAEAAWAVASGPGQPERLMRTTDGGASWVPVPALRLE
ncbi:MAG TPA: hypothetical protein VNT01_13610 [Symbiobacteriaceae bacterium]|nr:hypothetical protein [Symbiobacteriaceae bacterium]